MSPAIEMPALVPAHGGARMGGAAAEFQRNLNAAGDRQIAPDRVFGAANAQALAFAEQRAGQRRDGFAVDRGSERATGDRDSGGAAVHGPFAAAMGELDGCGADRVADQRVGDGVAFQVHGACASHAVAAPTDAAGILHSGERSGRRSLAGRSRTSAGARWFAG